MRAPRPQFPGAAERGKGQGEEGLEGTGQDGRDSSLPCGTSNVVDDATPFPQALVSSVYKDPDGYALMTLCVEAGKNDGACT